MLLIDIVVVMVPSSVCAKMFKVSNQYRGKKYKCIDCRCRGKQEEGHEKQEVKEKQEETN